MAQAERNDGHPAGNPMLWIVLIVVALVLFILFGGNRQAVEPAADGAITETVPEAGLPVDAQQSAGDEPVAGMAGGDAGDIETAGAAPADPGLEARRYIRELRDRGAPWPFDALMQKASVYLNEGRLADAWLLYFFAAREGHPEAMMTLAELSDPKLFQPDSSLLDSPDPVQAWKWYSRALDAGFEPARQRLEALRGWAADAARRGDREAEILLLNFR
jgi:TPR repeat protein